MTTRTTIRQGDILLVPAGAPADFRPRGDKPQPVTVGYGEVTGHHHVIAAAQWVVAPDTTAAELRAFAQGEARIPVFVYVAEPTALTHPEHDTLTVGVGLWRVIRQVQHVPGELPRAVYD